ncbi:hypothetical protein [uncultured Bacteroides sp.]|jgi:hypothetical protein|uniref:hypothetical protein n=1 Tax=uncultured Bacteroides sp. TaxID=162156 RepID=UPI0032205812
MITIEFKNDQDMHRFVSTYRGTTFSYHPNYDGQVYTDRILGSWTPLVHLERKKVKDFRRLGEDIRMFNGKIRPY